MTKREDQDKGGRRGLFSKERTLMEGQEKSVYLIWSIEVCWGKNKTSHDLKDRELFDTGVAQVKEQGKS